MTVKMMIEENKKSNHQSECECSVLPVHIQRVDTLLHVDLNRKYKQIKKAVGSIILVRIQVG